MRGAVAVALLLSTAACDTIFGLERPDVDAGTEIDAEIDAPRVDLDMDGIPDDEDLCVAPLDDGAVSDIDTDSVFDAVDPCPYDDPDGLDPDLDQLGNNCDPYPNMPGKKDRRRCLMRFSSLALNNVLWTTWSTHKAWGLDSGMLVAKPLANGMTLASTIVAQSIEGANVTTYDTIFQATQASDGSITLWLRANPAGPAPSDIGCRFVTEGGDSKAGIVEGTQVTSSMSLRGLPAEQSYVRIRARVVTAGGVGSTASVRCQIVTNLDNVVATNSVTLPEGRFAMTVDRWDVELHALTVFDQP